MKKKIIAIIGVLLVSGIALSVYLMLGNKNTHVFKVDEQIGDYYYSEGFSVLKSNVKVSSNMDTLIDIVNIDDDNDFITIGYLTQGLIEDVKLDASKKYRIRVKDNNDNKLNITITNIKETWTICYADGVSLTVKKDSLNKESVVLIIKNNTDDEYTYGEKFILEQYKKNKWEEVPTEELLAWNAMAYILDPLSEKEITINFKNTYGELSKGKYRIIKEVFKNKDIPITDDENEKISVEFEIE